MSGTFLDEIGGPCVLSLSLFSVHVLCEFKHESVTQRTGFMGVTVIMNKYFCSDHSFSPKIKHVVMEEKYIKKGSDGQKEKASGSPNGLLGWCLTYNRVY